MAPQGRPPAHTQLESPVLVATEVAPAEMVVADSIPAVELAVDMMVVFELEVVLVVVVAVAERFGVVVALLAAGIAEDEVAKVAEGTVVAVAAVGLLGRKV